jgi:hypothetical protein
LRNKSEIAVILDSVIQYKIKIHMSCSVDEEYYNTRYKKYILSMMYIIIKFKMFE